MVAGDLDDVESLEKAFRGSNVIFGVTGSSKRLLKVRFSFSAC